MRDEFRNFTKEQVYNVGYWDGLKKVLEKLRAKGVKKEIIEIISEMVVEAEAEHDTATFMLREGFIDF